MSNNHIELSKIANIETEEIIPLKDVNNYKIRKIRSLCKCLSLQYTDFNWKKILLN